MTSSCVLLIHLSYCNLSVFLFTTTSSHFASRTWTRTNHQRRSGMVFSRDGKHSAEKPTLCSSDTKNQETNALGGTLSSIPLELREAIYRLLFSEGHLCILQVSKYINAEATAVLYKIRPCWMSVGYPQSSRPKDLGPRPVASCFPIQSFAIEVNFTKLIGRSNGQYLLFPAAYFEPISVFGDPYVCRQSMVLVLDRYMHNSAMRAREYLKMLFEECRHVLGFRHLLLVFLSAGPDESSRMKRMNVQGIARDMMDPKLGPSVCFDIEQGLCVGYKPWDYISRQCRVNQEYWRGIQYTRFTHEGDEHRKFPDTKADALQCWGEEVLKWQLGLKWGKALVVSKDTPWWI